MATASDNPDISITVMEEELLCYICYNLLREPKDLDCPHVYCLLCLQDWVGKEPTVDCPECRHITIVPPGGLTNLKTNLRLKNMAEKYALRVEKQKDVPICPNHEGERQHFFCMTCGVTVCHNCLVLDHERIKELKVITKTRKTEMKAKLDRVQKELSKVEGDEKKLDEIKRKLKAAKEEAEIKVDRRTDYIIADAESKRKAAKERIEAISHQHLKILREENSRTSDRGKRLRNVHAADMACLHFNPGSDPVLNPAWFGKVVENDHVTRKLTLVTEFGTFKKAQSVAATQTGLLAVVDNESKEVIVYRDDNGEFKRHFCLDSSADDPNGKITDPFNIAVTSECKFLLIDEGPVKVFSPTGKYEKVLPDIYGDWIATTPDDMIVIGNVHTGVTTVHQPNGKLLKTHQLGAEGITNIASNGRQIAFTNFNQGKAYVIDIETGRELWGVNLVCPLGICLDEKSSSVMIAGNAKNYGHNVIEQYCVTTGRLISRLASGLRNPMSMTITHDGKLAVADKKSVRVYSIQ